MAKPITELTKDIRKLIEDGRAVAGPEIVESLQRKGPWWTGNFGRLWELDIKPIKPVVSNERDIENPKDKPTSFLKLPPLRAKIQESLYIGNLADYAGYAVNKDPIDGETYASERPPKKRTAESVDWYEVYTETGRDTGLFLDLDKAFASVRLG
ncbi:putative phage tail protein [uncultured Mediterranean phage MEDS2 group]|nr:putative phage tail protein [uncultured Mediterranean phage MEDS2 group]